VKSRWKGIDQVAVSRHQRPDPSSRRRECLVSNHIPVVLGKIKFLFSNGAQKLDWLWWGQNQQQITALIWSANLLLVFVSTVVTGSGSSRTHGYVLLPHDFESSATALLCSAQSISVQFSPVSCWWSSPAQSFLVSSPVGTHYHFFFSFQDRLCFVYRSVC
jgi:hypothetical protein